MSRVDNPDAIPIVNEIRDDMHSPRTKNDDVETKPIQSTAPEDDRARQWTNRRRMAWVSLIAMLIVTGLVLFAVPETRLLAIAPILDMFYIGMVSIVGAFIGFQTWWNVRRGK